MTPSPCRMVMYQPTDRDRAFRSIMPGPLPAMVIRRNDDGSVNLKVFNDQGIDFTVQHTFEGDADGRWSWPKREEQPNNEYLSGLLVAEKEKAQ